MTLKLAIWYGTETGTTEHITHRISRELNAQLETDSIVAEHAAQLGVEAVADCDVLLFGTSTWGFGDLPYDWSSRERLLRELDFSGKCVALFGLGDQYAFGSTFCDAMRTLYDIAVAADATVIGRWPVDGYEHDQSLAIIDGGFVGLALDEVNQPHLTDARIAQWCSQIIVELASAYTPIHVT